MTDDANEWDAAEVRRAVKFYRSHACGDEEIRYLMLYRSLSAEDKQAVANYAATLVARPR